MAWSDDEVEEMIYKILDAAQGNGWQIEKMPPTLSCLKGLVVIRGERSLNAKSKEEADLMAEAFDRMENERYWIRQENGVVYKVGESGRKAYQQWKQFMNKPQEQLSLIAFSYGPDDVSAIAEWEKQHNASVMVRADDSHFRDNVSQLVMQSREANVDGFLLVDGSQFKPAVLARLYQTAKDLRFKLYAVNRGDNPFTDDDFPEPEATAVMPASLHVIEVHGNQNVIATSGGINQQITNHLEILKQTQPDVAEFLQKLSSAVRAAELQAEETQELLERIDVLVEEVSRKPEDRHKWSIVDRAKGIVEKILGLAVLYHGAESLAPYAHALVPLITKAIGG